jgi:ferric-dicitrate binding protein FerR (iron transport regulator)
MKKEDVDHFQLLLKQYLSNTATPAEVRELMQLLKDQPEDSLLKEEVAGLWNTHSPEDLLPDTNWENMYADIVSIPVIKPAKTTHHWWKAVAAVFLAALAGVGIWQLLNKKPPHGTPIQQYTTITVPKGGKVRKLVLEDGTTVSLHAASTLVYPVAFQGNLRAVTLTGEAYFEVAKDPARKFLVSGGNITTEVLGTDFNVQAYPGEEAVKVTLMEGSVKVKGPSNDQTVTIAPGQQAKFSNGKFTVVDSVNTRAVSAWVNGYLTFAEVPLPVIMQELSRVYNVQVSFKDDIRDPFFLNDVPVNTPLPTLLKVLELTKVAHFTIKGDTIEVSKFN